MPGPTNVIRRSMKIVFPWLCVVAVTLTLGCGGPKSDAPKLADLVVARAVQEASALAGPNGDVVFVRFAESPGVDPEFLKLFREGFLKASGKAGIKLRADEIVAPNPAGENSVEPVTRDAFMAILRKHADAKLILSTVSVPKLTAQDLAALGPKRPKFLLVSGYAIPYYAELPAGLIDSAIVPWNAIPGRSDMPPSDAGLFDRYYCVVKSGAAKAP